MTNRQLLSFHQEIQGFSQSILYQFNRAKISEFYKQNSIRINSLMEKLSDLNREFFQYDDKALKMGEDKKPLLIEGKERGEFDLRLNEILDREISIIV